MTDAQQRAAAAKFAEYWQGKGYEKGESQKFWLSLLRGVFGVAEPEKFIFFEDQVRLDHTSFIDGSIPSTRVLIEQKGLNKDLRAPIRQSDGSLLTPFQQAKRYVTELPVSQHPRWIVTCNFSTFLVYDMEKPNGEPEEIHLADLEKEYYRLQFLVDVADANIQKEMEISIQAGELVGKLYDAILKQYIDPTAESTLKSLNMLCVRLVFCLYAEDAGIFGKHNMFHNYMQNAGVRNARRALIDLFRVLDTKPADRDRYMDEELAAFPYVNGGLFSDKPIEVGQRPTNESDCSSIAECSQRRDSVPVMAEIEIPQFTEEILTLLLNKASEDFDWRAISPTIFGAVFESTLNPETRRSGGMHYTSIENIHKVIDPLFLDGLRKELDDIREISVVRTRTMKLRAFQEKLAGLTFLDPACGSGNFLTETYISLRRLENEVIRSLIDAQKGAAAGQIMMGLEGDLTPIMVSIQQFYGIEINDFAATVAKTALWIAESQMMKQTEDIVHMNIEFLPLKSYVNIVEGNALRLDWSKVVPKDKLDYIMGNPPFVGASMMSKAQKDEAVAIFGKVKRANSIDYVGAWYHKAAQLIKGTNIRAAFVSTNSITQGEQVAPLWGKVLGEYNATIIFAHRTFKWMSEASDKAAVHCVIIGFADKNYVGMRLIYSNGVANEAANINPYLVDAPDVLVESMGKPLGKVPVMTAGNKPSDGGNLILSEAERTAILAATPDAAAYIREYVGSKEFINGGEKRYCLWLKGVSPALYRNNAEVRRRLEAVREMRLASTAAPTRAMADKPYLFFSAPQTDKPYLCIPEVSSERRRYIPIGFMPPEIIASNKLLIVPEAELYHFGVLTSNVHMAWMRTVCGRMKSDYSYSGATVYNTFPWPTPTDVQKAAIEHTAQAILDARALYPDCSLADLYDEVTMPVELRRAHQANDKAVMQAYGFWGSVKTESDCVARLMEMYAGMTKE